jgi:uncharacterized protein YjbJ (UPF0337 family)
MNWDVIKGNWKELKGHARETWGKLTDSDLDQIAGQRDQLLGKLQQQYGWGKDEAEKQLDQFMQHHSRRSASTESGHNCCH